MSEIATVIASGNLATRQRTITGVLGQFGQMEVPPRQALDIVTAAGLPARALEAPDFPISLQQELEVALGIVRWMGETRSSVTEYIQNWDEAGIEYLGVVGIAMRHAATTLEALKTCFTYPQLIWGHSRLVVSRTADASLFSFHMERPDIPNASEAEIDRLVQHCIAQDLVSSARNIQDIVDSEEPPRYIQFAFPEPADWHRVAADLPCPVYFSAGENSLAYPAAFDDTPLPHANPLIFGNFMAIAEKLSQMLVEDIDLSERVTRWLWAYTPPLKRGEIAAQLAMSERSLTRQLAKEGSSYAQLLAVVQEERARNFLRNPRLSVADIGYRLGYSEPAAFTRAFSNWTGISPLRWRQQVSTKKQT